MHTESVLKNELKQRLAGDLPGWKAHIQLAPMERIKGLQECLVPENARPSAVVAIIFPKDNDLKILLILRSVYNGAHSGQISFPGGQKEDSDPDLLFTALREVNEEVGIRINSEQILGKLTSLFIPHSNFLVEPYVAFLDKPPEITIDPSEVQKAHVVSVADLLAEESVQIKEVTVRNMQDVKAPCFYVDGLKIWGATAMILSELIYVIRSNRLL